MNPWTPDILVDTDEAGRALGHDLHQLSQIPRQDGWPAPVRQGFDAAAHQASQARQAGRGQLHGRRHADRFTAKWLQLRLNAWRRQRAVAADVTPQLLRELDVARCPVTRAWLTHGTLQDTDASVDRLNNDAAYAASNLAVMSVRANRAKGALNFAQVLARAESATATEGLAPAEWLRLAVLMLGPCHATRPHEAPALPLCAPLPVHAVRLALQQVQRLFTEHCQRPAGKNRLLREFAGACHSDTARLRLMALGQAVHEGLKHTDDRWDVWLQPAVMTALLRWREALDEADWARAAALSGRLSQARRETPERLRLWQLPTRGFVPLPAFPS